MKLTTNNFKLHLNRQFVESITEAANNIYYVFLGHHEQWTNDDAPPTPSDNVQTTQVDVYEKMIVGKKVSVQDVQIMISRNDWVSGTIYDQYTHDDPLLFTKKFFVVVPRGGFYDVFKCISNNGGVPSTDAPDFLATSAEDEMYQTLDGYQWKYMFSVNNATFSKFATNTLMPVVASANVTSNAISGTIDYVGVVSGGSNYNTYANGVIQLSSVNGDNRLFQIEADKSSNNNFYVGCAFYISSGPGVGEQRSVIDYIVSGNQRYVKIDEPFDTQPTTDSRYEINPYVRVQGDGNGFIGRALINASSSNSIYKVEIVNRGVDYTYATANATLTVGVTANTANLKPIISPQGGHGFDAAAELGAKSSCISVNFNGDDITNDSKLLDTNQYRTIGLIKDPLFANVVLTFVSNTDSFAVGETVTQPNTGATGRIVTIATNTINLTDVQGYFVAGNSSVNMIETEYGTTSQVASVVQPTVYIDQTYKLAIDNVNGSFAEDEVVVQTGANGLFYYANSTVMRLTNKRGTFNASDDAQLIVAEVAGESSGATAKVTGVFPGDLVINSGQVLYIENMKPVRRISGQSETIKLILDF